MGQTGAEKCSRRLRKSTFYNHHTSNRSKPFILPIGLVRAKCTAEVFIAGQKCSVLFDTGSQVTTVSQTYYEQNLSHLKVKPLEHLEVKAANGQFVPYRGYVEVDVVLPKEFLALVTADTSSNIQSPVLIGTNTLDLAYEIQFDSEVAQSPQRLPYGFKVVMNVLRHKFKQKSK